MGIALRQALFLAVFAICGDAVAEPRDKPASDMDAEWLASWNICDAQGVNATPDRRVKACTEVISRGETGNPNKTVYGGAFWDRAIGYCDQGLLPQALADYETAISYGQSNHVYETLFSYIYFFASPLPAQVQAVRRSRSGYRSIIR
jgi:hypothetical protein